MFRRAQIRRALSLLALLASLSDCATGSSAPGLRLVSSAVLSGIRPDAQHFGNDWMYSTSPGGNEATVYRRKGTALKYHETLSLDISSPEGSVATRSGWWYVANGGGSNVLIYRTTSKGPVGPIGTPLDDSGEVPLNVGVTPNRNLVAVSNAASAGSGTGSVSVYLNRETQPSRVLTFGSDLLAGEGIAIDPQGNCYWSFDDASKLSAVGAIVEFAQCSGSGTLVISGITAAGGLAFDRSGDLYYIDQASGVYKCQGVSHCKLFATGFGLAVSLNFDANYEHLWVADATGYLDAVDPQTGQIESQTISVNGDPYGIAPSPGS
jgi:DNA-binding beta-propeller fold protein YncE